MTSFETLLDCCDLYKNNRKNAARAQWKSLPEDFKKKAMTFAVLIDEQPSSELSDYEDIILKSKHGNLILSKNNLELIVNTIPELA